MAVPVTLSSVPAQTPYVQYVSGASQTVFPYPFEITQDSDLVCLINGVAQATDGGYTLSGQGSTNGGNLTFTLGQTAGTIITLYRNITIARITQLSQNGTFFSANFNNEFNKIYLILQQQAISLAGGNLALTVPITNSPSPNTLLMPANYAGKYLSFDSNGNPTPALLTSSGTITQALFNTFLTAGTGATTAIGAYGGAPSVTDNTTAINNAITAVAALGGGEIVFPSGTYSHSGTINLATGVTLRGYGAVLNYLGSGVQITSSSASCLQRAGMRGFTVVVGNATTSLLLQSPYACVFRDLQFQSSSTTNTIISLQTNISGSLNIEGNYNGAFSEFSDISQTGLCGTGILLAGSGPIGGPPVAVNTLHTFHNVGFEACENAGINFANWCDSNIFSGMCYVQIHATTGAATAYGVILNSAVPTGNVGVYDEHFDYLAIDYFGVGTNVVGVQMEFSANTIIDHYFGANLGTAGARDIQSSSGTYSYDINHVNYAGGNLPVRRSIGVSWAMGGAVNPSYGIYRSEFSLTGAGQASIQLSDTLSGTSLSQGLVIAEKIAPSTAVGAVYNVAIGNVSLGSSATLTNNIGVFIYDQTSGTNNYGIYSQITAGAAKYAFYAPGGAQMYTAGPLGWNGALPPTQVTGFGTPVGGAVVASYNITDAGGSNSNTNKCVAEILTIMKAHGMIGN